jgi:hypothetical protein
MSVSAFSTPATIGTATLHKRLLPASVSSYCTLTRNKGQRVLPDESVIRGSASSVFKVPASASRLSVASSVPAVTCHSSGISTGSVSSQSSETRSEVRKTRSRREEPQVVPRQIDRSRCQCCKTFTAVIFNFSLKAIVFVPGKLFQPILRFVGKAGADPVEEPFRYFTLG